MKRSDVCVRSCWESWISLKRVFQMEKSRRGRWNREEAGEGLQGYGGEEKGP